MKALGPQVVFATKCHVLPPRFAVVDHISDQIELPALCTKNAIIINKIYRHQGNRLSGQTWTGFNGRVSHIIETLTIWGNPWEGILPENIDCGVALDDCSRRYTDIGNYELDLPKCPDLPFVKGYTAHDETRPERKCYMPICGFRGGGSGISGFNRGVDRSASITHLEKGYESETTSSSS